MAGFQYQYGDKPLEGYTIQRGIGRGGFGEVYYALSDSGREVALKVIQGYEQIELRGVGQCMNLKSPHLITIFDVRHNAEGKPFVIMEYVAGPSLRDLIIDAPAGLGVQKAAFFLREIAKGLSYLHERGIVHRDLKPGNIFYEDGYVKIGDYGLSKAMSVSPHSGQTITVGTVHYMAPEIGRGKYDRGIDIYALGVVLYEMLTGQVPFLGGSHGEVLMKHLTDEPDLTGVAEPFATAIRKAMAKDPAERFQTVQEMVESVFGAEHIRESVSHFSPDSLSMVAERVAKKVAIGGGSSGEVGAGLGGRAANDAGSSEVWPGAGDLAGQAQGRFDQAGRRIGQIGTRVTERLSAGDADAPDAEYEPLGPADLDPLTGRQRQILFYLAAAVMATGTGLIGFSKPMATSWIHGAVWAAISVISFCAIAGAANSYLLTSRLLPPALREEKGFFRSLIFGGSAALGAFLGGGGIALALNVPVTWHLEKALLAVAVALIFTALVKRSSPKRGERVSLWLTFWDGLVGYISGLIFASNMPLLPAGIMAGVSLCLQVISPYIPPSLRNKGGSAGGFPHLARRLATAHHASADHHRSSPSPVNKPQTTLAQKQPSDRLRIMALLLSLLAFLVPIHGLQRFYVGKIGTGILWLCTLGCFYIGQIIDVVLIVAGAFTDKQGRRLLAWSSLDELKAMPGTAPGEGDNPLAKGADTSRNGIGGYGPNALERNESPSDGTAQVGSHVDVLIPEKNGPIRETPVSASSDRQWPARLPRNPSAVLLTITGTVLLVLAILAGLLTVVDLPAMVAAGLPDAGLNQELTREFGYEDWPRLVERVVGTITFGLMFLAAVALILARRRAGGAHMARVILGVFGLWLSACALRTLATVNWWAISNMLNNDRVGPAIEEFLNDAVGRGILFAAVTFLASVVILAWPARRAMKEVEE